MEKEITEGWVRYQEGFKLGQVRLNCEPHSSVYFHRWWSTGMMSFQRFCRLSGSCGPLEFEATFPPPRSSRAAKLNLRLWIYMCVCVYIVEQALCPRKFEYKTVHVIRIARSSFEEISRLGRELNLSSLNWKRGWKENFIAISNDGSFFE